MARRILTSDDLVEKAVDVLATRDWQTTTEIAQEICGERASDTTVFKMACRIRSLFLDLERLGWLERRGATRGTRWRLPSVDAAAVAA